MSLSGIGQSDDNTRSTGRPRKVPCAHARLVDEVLTEEGAKTGRLICKECLAEIQDLQAQPPTGD